MASVVTLQVPDLSQAAEYYEGLLAVTPKVDDSTTLVGDHVQVKLVAGTAKADTVLNVTSGMLARILDAAMKAKCQIRVDSPEKVRLTDQYGQRWTLQTRLS